MSWLRRRYNGPVCQCRHPLCMHYKHYDGYGCCMKLGCHCAHYHGPLPEPSLTEMEQWAQQVISDGRKGKGT